MTSLASLLPKPKKEVKPTVVSASEDVPETNTQESIAEESAIVSASERAKQMQLVQPNTIPKEYDEHGELKYDVLARVGHSSTRVLQTRLDDMLPSGGEKVWTKPSAEEIARQTEATKAALEKILAGKIKSTGGQTGQTSQSGSAGKEEFMKVTTGGNQQRIVRMVEAQKDPMEPPKFHHKRIPRPPPSPPAPVLHSPPRKVTKDEQEAWKIPPCISNWKNAKGYTIPLDKRLAADGRGLIEHGINPGFASFAESLYLAEQAARAEVEKRASVGQKLAEQQRRQHEENLRLLAEQARLEKSHIAAELDREAVREQVHGHDATGSGLTLAEREQIRQEQRRQHERDLRLSRMGPEQRAKYAARESDRDISEKIALGVAQPTSAGQESMYDQRLFDQTSGISTGFGDEDSYNLYSKPLFGAGSTAAHLIYKPSFASSQAMDEDDGEEEQSAGPSGSRKAFQGASEAPPRTGPVEFERAPSDPFGLDQMLQEAKRQKQ